MVLMFDLEIRDTTPSQASSSILSFPTSMVFVILHARNNEGCRPLNDLIAMKKVFVLLRVKLRWI
jgi:hypothetical protein